MDDITRLRQLLGIIDDRAVADDLQHRVANPEQRAEDVAEVLPRALDQARRDGRLARALRQPIEDTLHHAIEDNPRSIAEVLYPVMGPAIRRSISETLNAALEGLNQGLQMGFSRQGLTWRLESWRTGVPFREVVLRHTLKYRVSEAFLINKENGLLVARVGVVADDAMDRDAVAGMLTAIEDFVADSTGQDDDEDELTSANIGGQSMWILQGYAVRLALMIEGQPPLSLRMELQDRLAWMHENFGSFMASFDGTEQPPEALTEELERCLGFESKEDPAPAVRPRLAFIALTLLALVAVLWLGWSTWQGRVETRRWDTMAQLVAQWPGVVWITADRNSQPAMLRLLVDPLADDASEIPATAGFGAGAVDIAVHPYLSAEPEIVLRRLRAAIGDLPDGVVASADQQQIQLQGIAPPGWKDRFIELSRQLSSGVVVDTANLRSSGLASVLGEALSPPAAVEITDVDAQAVRISGQATAAWRSGARDYLSSHHPRITVDWDDLVIVELARLRAVASRLPEQLITFEADALIADPTQVVALNQQLAQILGLAESCDCELNFRAVGCSDQTGSSTQNQRIRMARASYLRQLLEAQGIDPGRIAIVSQCPQLQQRAGFVELEVAIK